MQDHLVEVWPENVESVRFFLELQGDWQTPDEFGGGFRLPTTEIVASMSVMDFADPVRVLQELQLMKRIAAYYLGKRHRESTK